MHTSRRCFVRRRWGTLDSRFESGTDKTLACMFIVHPLPGGIRSSGIYMEDTLAAGRRISVFVVLCISPFLLTPVGGLATFGSRHDGGNPSHSGSGGWQPPFSLVSFPSSRLEPWHGRGTWIPPSRIRYRRWDSSFEDPSHRLKNEHFVPAGFFFTDITSVF